MDNPFTLILKSPRYIVIFVSLFIFISISASIMTYVKDTSDTTADSLSETTNQSTATANKMFTEITASDTSLVVYSDIDPTYCAAIEMKFLQPADSIDNYNPTGSYTQPYIFNPKP